MSIKKSKRPAIRLDDAAVVKHYSLDEGTDEQGRAHAHRLDAAQTIFFARQLEEIDAQMYDVKYAKLEALELLATKTLHPGAESYTYRMWDAVGVAKMTSDYQSGAPRADVSGKEYNSRIRGLLIGYGYSVQEIRAAAMANLPLDAMRATAARRILNEGINKRSLLGDSEFSLIGLFNLANAGSYTVPPHTVGGTDTQWTKKTGMEMYADMCGIVDSIPTNTKEIEHAKRLLLPYTRLRLAAKTKIDSVSPITALQFFLTNRPGIEVRGALYLDTAAADSGMRMMAYDPSREVVELLLPIPFESFPPERKGMEWEIVNHARMGSVINRYPLACVYGDDL
jgi:hypothetical protein